MLSGRLPLLLLAGLFAGSGGIDAATLFRETFGEENRGRPTTNYAGFSKWMVTRGTVDLIGKGGGNAVADFFPGNNLYVDLDGSKLESGPGRIETKTLFTLEPGVYRFEFDLGANSAGGLENRMTASIGTVFSEAFTRPNIGPPGEFERISRTITINERTTGRIVFDGEGPSDYYGLIIDNVQLSRVSENASVGMIVAGLAILCLAAYVVLALRRRRRPARASVRER